MKWRWVTLFLWVGFSVALVRDGAKAQTKRVALLVLPVQYMEGATGEPKASLPLTRRLSEHVKKSTSHRLLSTPLNFQSLVGVVKDISTLTRLLGESKKPEQILSAEVSNLDGSYTLKAIVYHFQQGQWKTFKESPLLERKGSISQMGVWLGELWLSLFPPPISLQPKAGQSRTFTAGGVEFAMRWIPAGSFMMGSPSSETAIVMADCKRSGKSDTQCKEWYGNAPQRTVQISKGFWMLETEVTQGQYKALVGSNPSYFQKCGDNCPVEQVNWHDARAFANKLSVAEGLTACTETDSGIFQCKGWRLPTEAEWEYAARAGTTTATHNASSTYEIVGENNAPNLDGIAWYGGNSGVTYEGGYDFSGWKEKQYESKACGTQPVGGKRANRWGLKDMLGNVWEWTMDVYGSYAGLGTQDPLRSSSGAKRVFRGGGWSYYARGVRSANRNGNAPTHRHNALGFRLLRY